MLLGRGKVSEQERRVHDAVNAALAGRDNAGGVSEDSRLALLTLMGAALKCNGLSYEQGYMYFWDSHSSASLQLSGLHSLVAHLLGAPAAASSAYISDADAFTRLLLSSALDSKVRGRNPAIITPPPPPPPPLPLSSPPVVWRHHLRVLVHVSRRSESPNHWQLWHTTCTL